MNTFIIAYSAFLFLAMVALLSVSMSMLSDGKRKRKNAREFDELMNGDVYINRNDADNPFEDKKEYAVILDKMTNGNGGRYVQYESMCLFNINNVKHNVNNIRSMEWDSFIRIYKKNEIWNHKQ